MHKNQQAHVGLDIGSTHVLCVIGVSEEDAPAPSIIGVGRSRNQGVRKGVVVDLEDTIAAVSAAVDEAERISGYNVDGATIAVDGAHIVSLNSKGVIAVGGVDREITVEDVHRVEDAATVVQLPPNREIIQVFPRHYRLDGQEDIKDPVGMSGVRLEVDAHIVTGSTPAIRNLNRVVNQLNIDVHGQVTVGMAAARAVLSKRDKESGTALIDIGGSTTNVAVFEEGEVLHTAIIPVGSNHITNDLAICLKTDLETAEAIKLEHVRAGAHKSRSNQVITIKQGDKTDLQFKHQEVNEIVEARLSEIFSLIEKQLRKIDRVQKLPGGIVMTGGGAKLIGLVDYAKHALGLPARIAKPSGFTGIVDTIDGPQFATAVGLMLEDIANAQGNLDWKKGLSKTSGVISKFLNRFKP